jgi:hypothetical protein
MKKTAAMYWGEYRTEKRLALMNQAEAAAAAGNYAEAKRLADFAVRCIRRNKPLLKSKVGRWRAKLLARIPQPASLRRKQVSIGRPEMQGVTSS